LSENSVSITERIPLKRRVFNASAWSLGGYGVALAIRFGTNLIMTRLLLPEAFGIMAIATVVMMGLAMFSDLGLNQNIVQSRRGSDPAFLNTAWSVQIVRGLVLWGFALGVSLAIFLAAGHGLVPQDSVYADPVLPAVVAVLSFGTVIGGFASTKLAEASRNLALGRVTQREIVSQFAGLAGMLVWASVAPSVWVLVGGALLASLVRVILSHALLPGTANRWHWDRGAFHEIFHFGKWIFASSILGFLVSSGDRLMLGWLVDGSVLGVYAIAFLMFSAVEQVVTRINSGVAFPALSEVARSGRDLKTAYYRFHAIVASVAYFVAGALMTSGEALVSALYDPRYADAGWMLQILAVALMVLPFRLAAQCFLALGMPEPFSRIILVRLVALLVAMPVGYQLFGVPGALWGIVASQLLSLPVLVWYAAGLKLLEFKKEVRVLPMILVGAGVGVLLTGILSY
jgi:O-antigen/teichoic acid export membrane protein